MRFTKVIFSVSVVLAVVLASVARIEVRAVGPNDPCRERVRAAESAAQAYRQAIRNVRSSCSASTPECQAALDEAQGTLNQLIQTHAGIGTACNGGSEPPPAGPPTIPGDLVITEIMADPDGVPDADGEWFEIYNNTSTPFDLNGLVVRDDSGEVFSINTSTLILPGQYLVFGRNGDVNANGGVPVSFVYAGFNLSNTADQIEIRNGTIVIDRVAYTSASFPLVTGFSMALSSAILDATLNDDGANWCTQNTAYSAFNRGTPGQANACIP